MKNKNEITLKEAMKRMEKLILKFKKHYCRRIGDLV